MVADDPLGRLGCRDRFQDVAVRIVEPEAGDRHLEDLIDRRHGEGGDRLKVVGLQQFVGRAVERLELGVFFRVP